MVGAYVAGDVGEPTIQTALQTSARDLCAECSETITLLTIQDSPVLI
jgi:hypothetical protein